MPSYVQAPPNRMYSGGSKGMVFLVANHATTSNTEKLSGGTKELSRGIRRCLSSCPVSQTWKTFRAFGEACLSGHSGSRTWVRSSWSLRVETFGSALL
jgi:hypothetical protein